MWWASALAHYAPLRLLLLLALLCIFPLAFLILLFKTVVGCRVVDQPSVLADPAAVVMSQRMASSHLHLALRDPWSWVFTLAATDPECTFLRLDLDHARWPLEVLLGHGRHDVARKL